MNRIKWIDISKVICIYCVALAHTPPPHELFNALNAFFIPLFFFMGGYVFSIDRNPSYKTFVYKRFRQIIVPYIWINIVAYLFWLFIGRKYGNEIDTNAWYDPLIGIITGYPSKIIHDIPLWYLVCIFFTEIIYYPIKKYGKSVAGIIFFFVAGMINYYYNPYTLPYCLGSTMIAIVFYGLGNMMRVYNDKIKPNILILIISAALFMVLYPLNDTVGVHRVYFGNYFLFYAVSACGIILFMQISLFLSRLIKGDEPKWLKLISGGTLLICGLHLMTFALIKGVLLFGFGITFEGGNGHTAACLAMALGGIILCVPVIYIVRKYLRFLIDK